MKRTYSYRIVSRANEICGAFNLVHTETVHENGLVEWTKKGVEDGDYVNVKGTRQAHPDALINGKLDLERVHAYRTTHGWREVVS